ncbi:MAG: DUF2156 domain-containing protein [Spirochaetaceae bacterium]|nr:DUF2156 domain-containing protein [Spirochaetaceae bacterium]
MNRIPEYPESAVFSKDIKDLVEPLLQNLHDGISELTFYSLLIHSKKYDYRLTKTKTGAVLLLRKKNGKDYFVPLNKMPSNQEIETLKKDGYSAVLVGESILKDFLEREPDKVSAFEKDRDNADYVYLKTELAELKGKTFHKKKNHVNSFVKNYAPAVELLTEKNVHDAAEILEKWQQAHLEIPSDYETAKAALSLIGEAPFFGIVVYVGAEPAGFALGETLGGGETFCTHFEKGIESYKGIYQYLNQIMAAKLDGQIKFINREQDLGDEGLRQSKMTYRPYKFIEKYKEKI